MNKENKRKFKGLENTIIITSIICLFSFSFITIFNNKTIEKEIVATNNLKALDQEGQSYRLVTSADNVQVPVPKGYVASQVTEENYVTPEYQHTTNTYKVSSTPTELTWSSPEGEQYPWTQDSNGIWISGNQGIPSSESVLESEEFNYIKGTTLTIRFTVSCYSGDYLDIYLINLTNNITERISRIYGNYSASFDYTTATSTWTMKNGGTGRYKIRAIFKKDSSGDGGQDSGYIKTSTYFKEDENGTELFEEDIKTRVHDGGFVIYQLTDEEIETNPNGTSVIINDTNKDEAQSTRNQYVWVPVPNLEDITRTKTVNNGIMQFGQGYVFSNTSITKETGIYNTNYFREPRLAEKYDRTKNCLQRYLNIINREEYLNKMQEDFVRMIKSINKYKGFYIGRYETGDDISHSNGSSRIFFKNPKIVRYNSNIYYVSWYYSYKDLEKLSRKTGKYVETGMVYDSLWEYTLIWLNETDTRSYEDIALDSAAWGYMCPTGFKYKESANGTEKIKSENLSIPAGGITEIIYNGEIYNNSPTASNNIFDISGNVSEWTRGRNGDTFDNYRMRRGGDFIGDVTTSVSYLKYSHPHMGYENIGTRAQLYIL